MAVEQPIDTDPSTDQRAHAPDAREVGVYKAVRRYEYNSSTPKVTEEWVLWNMFNVPTDNFQNEWDFATDQWVDSKNKAARWKEQNPYPYETAAKQQISSSSRDLDIKMKKINQLQKKLNTMYESYEEHIDAIDNAEEKIIEAESSYNSYKEFFSVNDDGSLGRLELSVYDDTSEIDGDGIKVPVGRDKPMHLTTKVAEQFAQRFERASYNGAIDVRNYGPPRDGKQYFLPSNKYEFKFDFSKSGYEIVGNPIRIIDPSQFIMDNTNLSQRAAADMLRDLSQGFNSGVDAATLLSAEMNFETVETGPFARPSLKSWACFGSPGIPNEMDNNEWGFKWGPPDDNDEFLGGNYVRSYRDFLDLFQLGYNPDWPFPLQIVGTWPTVSMTESELRNIEGFNFTTIDRNTLENNTSHGIPVYTMIDENKNIIIEDDKGWYRTTGWYLDFSGDPVYLYPSRDTATKINTSDSDKGGVHPGGVLQTGGLAKRNDQGEGRNGQSGNVQWSGNTQFGDGRDLFKGYTKPGYGREPRSGQKLADFVADYFKTVGAFYGALLSGDIKKAAKLYGKTNLMAFKAGNPAAAYAGSKLYGRLKKNMALTDQALKKINDGISRNWKGDESWGGRIGLGQHCPNLTLDMKRSMIVARPSTSQETRFMGWDDSAFAGKGPPNPQINYSVIRRSGGFYVYKNNSNRYAEYEDTPAGSKPAKGATLKGPTYNDNSPYSNPEYPYGTGHYGWRDKPRQYGPYVFPEVRKNWIDWGDLLYSIGPENGYGFFTGIDNSNNTSCMVQPDGSITDGLEINDGFVKFIIENVFAPLPKNRRCGATTSHKPIVVKKGSGSSEVKNFHGDWRLDDVTYGDLFGPLRDGKKPDVSTALAPASFGNLDNFKINNVANIPIRAEVVNNLLNKNNTNMSVIQFLGEVFKPSSVGVNNIPNPQIAMRQGEDGTFEVVSLSEINYDKISEGYSHLFTNNLDDDENLSRFPEDIVVIDYKASDSLIENIDMNSTFDPLITRVFRDAAVDFTSNTDALLNFLSYKDVAPELKAFLDQGGEMFRGDNNPITIKEDGSVEIKKEIFQPDGNTPNADLQSAVSKFLQMNPARLNNMKALLNAADAASGENKADGKSYATNLMSNYMRKTTFTIHGTTSLAPFQAVIIRGVMPHLEGMYLITAVRESITPQGFQTIVEGSLVRAPSASAAGNDNRDLIPEQPQEPPADRLVDAVYDSGSTEAQFAQNF